MDIIAEIHTPGLDLHTSRWTHHLVFMQVVHDELDTVFERAQQGHRRSGRGALYVPQENWIQIVRDAVLPDGTPFPADFIDARQACEACDFGRVAGGFSDMMEAYDPEREFVLVVEHHPEGLLSAYMIAPSEEGETEQDRGMDTTGERKA